MGNKGDDRIREEGKTKKGGTQLPLNRDRSEGRGVERRRKRGKIGKRKK